MTGLVCLAKRGAAHAEREASSASIAMLLRENGEDTPPPSPVKLRPSQGVFCSAKFGQNIRPDRKLILLQIQPQLLFAAPPPSHTHTRFSKFRKICKFPVWPSACRKMCQIVNVCPNCFVFLFSFVCGFVRLRCVLWLGRENRCR